MTKPYPAFPVPDGCGDEIGMTLRDWFAGAPIGEKEMEMLCSQYFSIHNNDTVSISALRYFRADSMIAERNKIP